MGDIDFSEDGGGQEQAAPAKKRGGFPILKILMFVGIGLAALALIVTVVVVTVKILDSKGRSQTATPMSEEYRDVMPVYSYSSTLPEFRTRTVDKPPATVAVQILIGFDKGNKQVETELSDRKEQLRDFLRNYFAVKKAAELGPGQERRIKEELREKLNDMMKSKGIRDILFAKFDVIEM